MLRSGARTLEAMLEMSRRVRNGDGLSARAALIGVEEALSNMRRRPWSRRRMVPASRDAEEFASILHLHRIRSLTLCRLRAWKGLDGRESPKHQLEMQDLRPSSKSGLTRAPIVTISLSSLVPFSLCSAAPTQL